MNLQWLIRLEFAAPWLLLAAPVALLLAWTARGRGRSVLRYSSLALTAALPSTWRTRLAWLPGGMLATGLVLASVALARPRVGDEHTIVRSEGIAVQLVVDTSSSMLAHDLTAQDGRRTDRLSVVKSVVRDFVSGGDGLPGRPADEIGLVVFAGYADAVCPLTMDHHLLLDTLDAAEVAQYRFEDGTSIGSGLGVALGGLADATAESRVVILLTDGVNNDRETDPEAAAGVAKELGIRVYTIGVGSEGLAPYPVTRRDGTTAFRTQEVHIDEELLTRIAQETGGVYQRAGSTQSLRDIYAEIDRLERTELEGTTYRNWRELYPWPLAAGALLWVLCLGLEATVLRRLG